MEVAKAGAFTRESYECAMTGIVGALLAKIRAYAAFLQGEVQGRSTTARLYVTEAELAMRYAMQPIWAWVEAIWDGTVTKEEAISAWKYAMQSVIMANKPHEKIIGGVGALCGAMHKMGWPSFASFK